MKFKKILKFIRGMVVLFFASTILVVILYRFVPVVITPLMVIRSAENIATGESPKFHHSWVSMKEMPKDMAIAVMASEDQRFLSHHGFDIDAIEEAAEHNKHSEKKRGASTISQQTAKNVFLWPGRSWVRKGFEAYFTALIELFWTKERIMEVYLNSIEMGENIYGIQAVAEDNFNSDASELTAAECALIAATLPNPREYSSKDPSPYMIKRQRQITKQMGYMRTVVNRERFAEEVW